ncbi:MAG TPA: maleylacetoacetate isomerase [Polyangia bacterium]|jgi:maleylpyruvate isomerase
MILYDYWRSSSAWRVRIALHLKGVPFERRVVNLSPDAGEQHRDAFGALNPLRQVPVFIGDGDDARPLTQSMAIIELLEEQFPQPPLLPADPWRRARARQLAEMVNAGTQPLQNLSVLQHLTATGGDANAWARHFIARGLAALEAAASQETEGTFLVGDTPTLADLYLVPQMYNARRWAVDLAPFPTLVRVDAACAALPAFAAAHPDEQSDARPPV